MLMVHAQKYKQLKALLHSLLPRRREGAALSSELEDLLDDADEDNPISLCALRQLCIQKSRHDQTWRARAPVGSLKTGDYGYIPGGSTDFANFVRLGNILEDFEDGKAMEVVGETTGTMHMRTNGFPSQPMHPQPASPFILPDELECWPMALPPRGNAVLFVHNETGLVCVNAAWRLLIAHGATVASTHGIMPQDVILGKSAIFSLRDPQLTETNRNVSTVTRSLRVNDYQIDDWSPSMPSIPGIGFGAPGFGGGAMGFPSSHHGGFAAPIPSIVYLVTSSRLDFTAYLTDNPMGRPRPRATRTTSWCYNSRNGWYVRCRTLVWQI